VSTGVGGLRRGCATVLALWSLLGCEAPSKSVILDAATTPVVTPSPTVEQQTAQAKSRYDTRPTINLPKFVPPAWKAMVAKLAPRLTRLDHEVRAHQSVRKGSRWLELEFRLFGVDAILDARVHEGLVTLGLPGIGTDLPTAPVMVGDVHWSIDVDRLVAPSGASRESRYIIKWRRVPPPPDARRRCRKPPVVQPPIGTPGWLVNVTQRRTTRQRIRASTRIEAKGQRVTLATFFRNGYAQDETVGQVTRAARQAGYAHQSGNGPKQRWRHPNGSTLRLHPEKDDLQIGCVLEGPVLELTWTGPGGS
jgi:hypothetical protein